MDQTQTVRGIFLLKRGIFFDLPLKMDAARLAALIATRYVKIQEDELEMLDVILAAYGFVMSTKMRNHLKECLHEYLRAFADWIVPLFAQYYGTPHQYYPLYLDFPHNVPKDMHEQWLKRFLSLFRDRKQPCLWCGTVGQSIVLEPCHHIVCTQCFDMSKFSACPVCQCAINREESIPARLPAREMTPLKIIDWGGNDYNMLEKSQMVFKTICTHAQAPSQDEEAILKAICTEFPEYVFGWMPSKIPYKRNLANILGTLLQNQMTPQILENAKLYIKRPTDILRMIAVYSGQNGALCSKQNRITMTPHDILFKPCSLDKIASDSYEKLYSAKNSITQEIRKRTSSIDPKMRESAQKIEEALHNHTNVPKQHLYAFAGMNKILYEQKSYRFDMAPISRPMRRAILTMLESFDADTLKEDMMRHANLWVWVGQHLHPGEYAKQFPKTAEAFALIRRKNNLGERIAKPKFWNYQFVLALRNGDLKKLLNLSNQRPGEFLRRFDWMMRELERQLTTTLTPENELEMLRTLLANQFTKIIQKMTSPALLTFYQHLTTRKKTMPCRLFIPSSTVRQFVFRDDNRRTLTSETIQILQNKIVHELIARFSQLPKINLTLIDAALSILPIPFNQIASNQQNVDLAPGSRIALPDSQQTTMRLFLHWCQKEDGQRADLDLSAAFFDKDWNYCGACAYYENTFTLQDALDIAVHSGDRQDAPWPDGATEFIDINRERAKRANLRYVVMLVQCYTATEFNELSEAFAGLMYRNDVEGSYFDPKTVKYRFTLSGNLANYFPFVIDLEHNTLTMIDLYVKGHTAFNNADNQQDTIRQQCKKTFEYFSQNPRPSRFTLALLHACARSNQIAIRYTDAIHLWTRKDAETPVAFFYRILNTPDSTMPRIQMKEEKPDLAFLLHGDLELPEACTIYEVFRQLRPEHHTWTELL